MFTSFFICRLLSQDELMKTARERRQKYLSRPQEEHHRLLVPRTTSNHWSNTGGYYSKENIPSLVTGQQNSKWDEDRMKMEQHLRYSSLDHAMYPEKASFGRMFNPLEIPIMDILAVDTEREFGWQYPSQATLVGLQANRGLARSMMGTCEVREIILNGEQTEDEQKEIIDWHYLQLAKDQVEMP